MNKIDKARTALEDIFYNGKLQRYRLTIEEANEVWNSLANILKCGFATTISTNVKNFFEKRNFRVTSDEIGWIITC
jgi:hypothetical protein